MGLLCCWGAVGSESAQPPAAGLPCNVWGRRGLPGPTAQFGVGEEGTNDGAKAVLGCTGDQPAMCLLWNQQNIEII